MKISVIFSIVVIFLAAFIMPISPAFAGDHCHGPIRYEPLGTTIKIWLEGPNANQNVERLIYQIGLAPRKTFTINSIVDLGDPGKSIRIFIGDNGLRLIVNFQDGNSPPFVITGSIWIPEFNINPNHDSKNPIALACEAVPFG